MSGFDRHAKAGQYGGGSRDSTAGRRDSAGGQAGQCGGQAGQCGGQAERYEVCAGQIRQGQIGKCLALSKPIQHVHAVYERE
jgi:hypothetical protein